MKQVLRERVDEVRVGGRLRQSAACLGAERARSRLPDAGAAGRRGTRSAVGGAEPRAESGASARAAARSRERRSALRALGACCCSSRPCSPKDGSSMIPPRSSRGSTSCSPTSARRAPERREHRQPAATARSADVAAQISWSQRRARGGDRRARRAPTAIAVVCHPHPLQQGTMHNKVVTTLARAFARSAPTPCGSTFAASAPPPAATRTESVSATMRSPSSRGAASAGRVCRSISAASRSVRAVALSRRRAAAAARARDGRAASRSLATPISAADVSVAARARLGRRRGAAGARARMGRDARAPAASCSCSMASVTSSMGNCTRWTDAVNDAFAADFAAATRRADDARKHSTTCSTARSRAKRATPEASRARAAGRDGVAADRGRARRL